MPIAMARLNSSDSINGRDRTTLITKIETVRTPATLTSRREKLRRPTWKAVSAWRSPRPEGDLPERGGRSGGDDHPASGALVHDGAHERAGGEVDRGVAGRDRLRGLLRRHRLPGQHRLVALQLGRLDNPAGRREPRRPRAGRPRPRGPGAGVHAPLFAVAPDQRVVVDVAAQGGDRLGRAVLVDEAERHAQDHDPGDDRRVRGVPGQRGHAAAASSRASSGLRSCCAKMPRAVTRRVCSTFGPTSPQPRRGLGAGEPGLGAAQAVEHHVQGAPGRAAQVQRRGRRRRGRGVHAQCGESWRARVRARSRHGAQALARRGPRAGIAGVVNRRRPDEQHRAGRVVGQGGREAAQRDAGDDPPVRAGHQQVAVVGQRPVADDHRGVADEEHRLGPRDGGGALVQPAPLDVEDRLHVRDDPRPDSRGDRPLGGVQHAQAAGAQRPQANRLGQRPIRAGRVVHAHGDVAVRGIHRCCLPGWPGTTTTCPDATVSLPPADGSASAPARVRTSPNRGCGGRWSVRPLAIVGKYRCRASRRRQTLVAARRTRGD